MHGHDRAISVCMPATQLYIALAVAYNYASLVNQTALLGNGAYRLEIISAPFLKDMVWFMRLQLCMHACMVQCMYIIIVISSAHDIASYLHDADCLVATQK